MLSSSATDSSFIFQLSSVTLHSSSLILFLVSSVRQHRLDSLLVRLGHQHINVEQSLPLVCFLRQNVARMRVAAFDLSGRGQAKAFRRTLVCF